MLIRQLCCYSARGEGPPGVGSRIGSRTAYTALPSLCRICTASVRGLRPCCARVADLFTQRCCSGCPNLFANTQYVDDELVDQSWT
jgi:hypothetical protein